MLLSFENREELALSEVEGVGLPPAFLCAADAIPSTLRLPRASSFFELSSQAPLGRGFDVHPSQTFLSDSN
jgi:hypothetical protein